MIEKDKYVKIIFNDPLINNILQIEGIVELWSDDKAIISSIDKKEKFVILNPNQYVLGVKVCNPPSKIEEKPQKIEETIEKFEQEIVKPSNDDLRLKNLASLKKQLNEQERKILTEKLKEHTISSDIRLPTYERPNLFKK